MLSWRLIRHSVTVLIAVALVLSAVLFLRSQASSPLADARTPTGVTSGAPDATTPAPTDKTPKPVVKTKQTVVPKAAPGAAKNVVAELPQTRTTSYGMVGVTWAAKTAEDDHDISVAIRSLVKDVWTPWRTLENDDDSASDEGRPGTEPIWVGEADGVAVRVTSESGTRPDDIKVMTIDPGGEASQVDQTNVTTAANISNGSHERCAVSGRCR